MMLRVIAITALLTACATPVVDDAPEAETEMTAETAMALEGSEWSIVGDEPSGVFIQFRGDGTVSGSAGCNRMNGTYEQDGTALTVGPLMMTRKLCAPPLMEAERRVSKALEAVRTVEASHLKLKLFDASGDLLLDLKRNDWD